MNEPTSAPDPASLRVKIFADGAEVDAIRTAARVPHISGFTTNPTLMRKAGVDNYERFGREVVSVVGNKPVSLEVFSDEFDEMAQQAKKMASWGDNVYVKIPVTNTRAEPSTDLVRELTAEGVRVNVTAVFTLDQVRRMTKVLDGTNGAYISIFAGRIADTGRDPVPHMMRALEIIHESSRIELIWASPRELLNIAQADEIGCDIITVTNDLLAKLDLLGKDLEEFSLETVQMFRRDAIAVGYSL
jgi:transaldolase